MSIPTSGETFAQLIEHLRKAQEKSAMMAHLLQMHPSRMDELLAKGWLGISELIGRMIEQVTKLAQGRMN